LIDAKLKTDIRSRIKKRLEAIEKEDITSKDDRAIVTLDQQSVGRLSRMDAMQQKAMADATFRRRQAQKVQLEAALKRLASGEFGACQDCGEDIAPERLLLSPTVLRCKECATA